MTVSPRLPALCALPAMRPYTSTLTPWAVLQEKKGKYTAAHLALELAEVLLLPLA